MPTVTLDLDQVGWFSIHGATTTSALAGRSLGGALGWQNITSDEMLIGSVAYPSPLPTTDISSLRELFRGLLVPLRGALITCDVVTYASMPAIRCIAKYHPAKGMAMTYVGAITVPVGATHVIELAIRAVERGITGIRETLVLQELIDTAGISELEQLAQGIIPIEWKFERYHPGSRGDAAYLLSDDEQYDEQHPDHPLSRVRRCLRRVERTFSVIVENAAGATLSVALRQPAFHAMGKDEMIRELGVHAFADAIIVAAARRSGVHDLPLSTRQKVTDDRMTDALKKQFEQSKERRSVKRRVSSRPWSREEAAEAMCAIYDAMSSSWGESFDPRLRDMAATALVNRAAILASLNRPGSTA